MVLADESLKSPSVKAEQFELGTISNFVPVNTLGKRNSATHESKCTGCVSSKTSKRKDSLPSVSVAVSPLPQIPKIKINVKEALKKGHKSYEELKQQDKKKRKSKKSEIQEPAKKVKLATNTIMLPHTTIIQSITVDLDVNNSKTEVKTEPEPGLSEFGILQTDKAIVYIKRKVSSLGYTIQSAVGVASFACLQCQTNFKSSLRDLLNHLSDSHRTSRWFGNCCSCSSQIEQGNVFDELMHLVTAHVIVDRQLMKNVGLIASSNLAKKSFKSFLKDLRARAKFQLKQQLNPPMISIPNSAVITPETSSKLSNKKMQMCPWISEGSDRRIKNGLAGYYMSKEYLTSKFKCMNLECGFSTSYEKLFFNHLDGHKFQNNFSNHLCSYCFFSTTDAEKLVAHLLSKHSSEKFQCATCMYRSSGNHIKRHIEKFHQESVGTSKTATFYELPIEKSTQKSLPSKNSEHVTDWINQAVHVPMITCMRKLILRTE